MHALRTLRYKLWQLSQNINPTETRGEVTPQQAMDYVRACSCDVNTFEPIRVERSVEQGLVMWNVVTNLVDHGEIDFHVWAVEPGDYGYSFQSSGVYGEW